jgi:8-oxo-dGTP diphosphatase
MGGLYLITTQNNGWEFIEFLILSESDLAGLKALAGSFAIIELDGKYLLCFNRFRQQIELPAGKREPGETAIQCARREVLEETGQEITDFEFIGVARQRNLSGNNIKDNPVFYASIKQLMPFIENSETTGIMLWDLHESIHIDQADLALLINFTRGEHL